MESECLSQSQRLVDFLCVVQKRNMAIVFLSSTRVIFKWISGCSVEAKIFCLVFSAYIYWIKSAFYLPFTSSECYLQLFVGDCWKIKHTILRRIEFVRKKKQTKKNRNKNRDQSDQMIYVMKTKIPSQEMMCEWLIFLLLYTRKVGSLPSELHTLFVFF